MKVVAVCLLNTKLIGHQRYSQLWHHVVWQIHTDITEYLPPPSRVMEVAGSHQTMLYIYQLTVAGPRWRATPLSTPWEPQISFYMTLNKYLKSWPKSGILANILGFYAGSNGNFLPSFRDNGGGEILTAVLVKMQVIWDISPFIFIVRANSPKMKALSSTKMSVTVH